MPTQREYEHKFTKEESKIFSDYYDFLELYDHEIYYYIQEADREELVEIQEVMLSYINAAPNFLDSYLIMIEVCNKLGEIRRAERHLEKGYKKALELILDEKGNWPDIMEWAWLENRHIIRLLKKQAEHFWDDGMEDTLKHQEAIKIYENLIKTNPRDNVGARYPYLAMLEGMDLYELEKLYENEKKLDTWFENKGRKREELKWWFTWVEELEKPV